MKKYVLIIALLFITINTTFSQFQMGVNLDNANAFVNLINHTNRFSNVTSFDEFGNPMSDFDLVLLDGRPVPEWINQIDDPEEYRIDYSGTYHSSFIGQADISISGTSVSITNKIYDETINTTTFDINVGGYPNANHGLAFLKFTNTKLTPNSQINTGISKLRVLRPGYDLNNQQTFTDEFINLCKSADFACYRFYNVQNIWGGEPVYPNITSWETRKTPNDITQQPMTAINGKRDGWCWEYMIELANILNKDIWINMHISCDSNYVAELAKMLKENLNPSINIYIENSNEVWSPTQETHGPYNQAQAEANVISFDENYARRTVELSNWFGNVFGQDEINKRIRVILAGQQAYIGRTDNHLNYIKNNLGEPSKFIYATSTALYFQSTKSNNSDPDQINDGMLEDINRQTIDFNSGFYRINHLNRAKDWGFVGGCTSYEGGAHLPSSGVTNNLDAQILAHRTEKMKDILKYNFLDGWKNLGGGLAMNFTLFSGYNRYGCWGLTDDPNKPDRNHKMQAMRDIIATYTSVESDETNYILYSLKVFPNPSNENIKITNENNLPINLNITNLIGLVVWSGTINKSLNFNLPYLTNGIYYVNSKYQSIPFVIER